MARLFFRRSLRPLSWMRLPLLARWVLMVHFGTCAFFSPAAEPMSYLFHSPESSLDNRYEYHWTILRAALERTKPKYGEYLMVPSPMMAEKRQAQELKAGTGNLTVMYLSTTPDFERNLVPIRIPVDKNLGGYCVFLTKAENQPRFDAVKSLKDLRKFTFGLGLGWIDVEILRSNSFTVVTGSNYDGLFEMVRNGRFDIFLRAATEVLGEVEQRKTRFPELYIEKRILFYYPLPMYFWFAKTDHGRRLAARAQEGMWSMIEDGTFDQIFDRYHRASIESLRLKQRRLFRIENPFVGPETPFADKRLWFDPFSYQPGPSPQ
jgi:ABC-type amino acid transport substrate-binding protein